MGILGFFGLSLNKKSTIDTLKATGTTLGNQVVAALGDNDVLVKAADAAIASFKADTRNGVKGILKLEDAGMAVLPVLLSELASGNLAIDMKNDADKAKHVAIAFVQSRFLEIETEAASFVSKLAKALGLTK